MIPTDPEATKLRILAEREGRAMKEAEEAAYQQRRQYERAWVAYVARVRELGYCAFCEKPLSECKCLFRGAI